MFCMLITAGITGFLPIFIPSIHKKKSYLSIANCFAAGIFLIVGMAALLPDAQEAFEKDLGNKIPLGYILSVAGYIIMFFLENILFNHSHHDDEIPLEIQESTLNGSGLINSEYQAIPTAKSLLIDKSDLVSGIILTLALVIHSTFEGIAIGLLNNNSDVITLCVAVMIHNIPAAIALGIKMKRIKTLIFCILMGSFVISSPLSIMIGIFLSDLGIPIIQGLFLSFSAGTFIYISCSEILPEELAQPGNKNIKFLAFLIGCVPLGIAAALI